MAVGEHHDYGALTGDAAGSCREMGTVHHRVAITGGAGLVWVNHHSEACSGAAGKCQVSTER
ncbi:hypothetical protein CCHOA_06925 [Corynebacterium choanae]|uniref:Uncharacterized protein n=1 Tax=Corynebacterium choanae TaxID=1862358 RepID=A0A3G6J6T2_9CORY|nr:hypothetical protein CCHOA_06925 [Corynebacterium choanae]